MCNIQNIGYTPSYIHQVQVIICVNFIIHFRTICFMVCKVISFSPVIYRNLIFFSNAFNITQICKCLLCCFPFLCYFYRGSLLLLILYSLATLILFYFSKVHCNRSRCACMCYKGHVETKHVLPYFFLECNSESIKITPFTFKYLVVYL